MRTKNQRRVKIPTPSSLKNISLFYLSRFAASEHALRKVLENRIRKASMQDQAFAADAEAQGILRNAIETIIKDYRKTGALNDDAYAAMKIAGLRRAGKSRRAIQQKLAAKGIGRETAAKMFAGDDDEADTEAAEMKAATVFARRKKLGPWGKKAAADRAQKQKEIASMARGGFSLDIIRKVLGKTVDDMDF